MLIVAIPKSGSTAIMETLGKGHRLTFSQFSHQEVSPDKMECDTRINPLRILHGDLYDYDASFLAKIANDKEHLYKQHIAPSANNLAALRNERIVVLLRSPEEIVDAYFRGFQRQMHRPPPGSPKDMDIERWRKHAAKTGVLAALEWFHSGWLEDPSPNWLFLDFHRLTKDQSGSIRAVEEHLGLPISGLSQLRKARYSKSWFIPYRHNRIWRDRVAQVRGALDRLLKAVTGRN